jgi:FkbM family methyltransferase
MRAVTFHRIWFGSSEIPDVYESYWRSWQRQFPQYNFKTWTDKDIAQLSLTRHVISRAEGFARKADIARYEILLKFGGVYLDCDIMPYHYFDPVEMVSKLTVCNEDDSEKYCSIGFIAAPAGEKIFVDLINHLCQIPLNQSPPNIETGPHLFGRALAKHDYRKLKSDTFYPYHYSEPYSAINSKSLQGTFGVHVWGGSWLKPEKQLEKLKCFIDQGDVSTSVEVSRGYSSAKASAGKDLAKRSDAIAELRTAAIEAVLNTDLAELIEFKLADKCLDLLKTAFSVLSTEKKPLVWQFGAADGVLVDPIRPAMINFDPQAVLIEPNPYMFARLRSNYAKNKNVKLLNRAYSTQDKNLVIHCINPAMVAENSLPEWVLGLSSAYTDKNAIGGISVDSITRQKIANCIEDVSVETVSLENLLKIHDGIHPSIVVIDVEGMDFTIVNDIIQYGLRPHIIQFEVQCMHLTEQKELLALLGAEYLIVPRENDWIAYRVDFIVEYSKDIYVRFGYPGPFKKFLKYAFRI